MPGLRGSSAAVVYTLRTQAGALAPLLEQLSSDNPAVNYHAAQALLARQGRGLP